MEWPKPDPITGKPICSECWNNRHEYCYGDPCECLHRERPHWVAKERYDKLRQGDLGAFGTIAVK